MNIGLDIYNMVVQIIGTLHVELTFVYGLCTILVFCCVIAFVSMPFVIVYKLFS